MNKNYRTLIQKGLIKPVSIFKRNISQVDTSDNSGCGRGRGGRGRGRGRTNNISAFQSTVRKILSKPIVGKHDKSIRIEELNSGTHMGMDSHADTTCVNKHAYIESIIEGLTVGAIPLDSSIGKMSNLPIINAIYAYNDPDLIHTILL